MSITGQGVPNCREDKAVPKIGEVLGKNNELLDEIERKLSSVCEVLFGVTGDLEPKEEEKLVNCQLDAVLSENRRLNEIDDKLSRILTAL